MRGRKGEKERGRETRREGHSKEPKKRVQEKEQRKKKKYLTRGCKRKDAGTQCEEGRESRQI